MKRRIPDTQMDTYKSILDQLPEKRAKVLGAVYHAPKGITAFQVCHALSWPINCVSGRLTELSNASLIEDSGDRAINPATGKPAIIWVYNPKPKQQDLVESDQEFYKEQVRLIKARIRALSPQAGVTMPVWQLQILLKLVR